VLTWGQVVVLAVLQGVTELFPVSSLGHSVVLTALLGWKSVKPEYLLALLTLLHLGTAAALFIFYRYEWVSIVRAFVRSAYRGKLSHTPDEHMAWMLFFGTIPAGIIGGVLQSPLQVLFGTPFIAAIFLVVNGIIMLLGERLRRRQGRRTTGLVVRLDEPDGLRGIQDLTWREALVVGSAQSFGLIPGLSRSGVTMCAGLAINMRHDEAAHYTFLMATPIIAAASLVEVPTLFVDGPNVLLPALGGGVVAAVAAYLSVRFLTRYFTTGRLDPFAYYCVAAGIAAALFIGIHGV
jgi:undecaprenyl-diphosphatase